MSDGSGIGSRRVAHGAATAGLVVAVIAVIFAVVKNLLNGPANWTSDRFAAALTGAAVGGGIVLAALIRLFDRRPASLGQWLRRSSAGALLLTPAATLLSRQVVAYGWDFATCGTLFDPFRPGGSELAGFRTQCDIAAGDRRIAVLIWAAVGCVIAIGYGILLRRTASSDRPSRGTATGGTSVPSLNT